MLGQISKGKRVKIKVEFFTFEHIHCLNLRSQTLYVQRRGVNLFDIMNESRQMMILTLFSSGEHLLLSKLLL